MSGSHSVDPKRFSVQQVGRNWDYGVYVTGVVKLSSSGIPVNFLVDTGAAMTVMSLLAYKRLPTDIQPALEPAEFELAGVSGNTLELVGTARMTLVFQGAAFTQDIPIIDIPVEAILGQDILLEHNGRLDLSNLTLRLREVLIPCWIAGGSAMTCRVVVRDETTIPAWSEKMVSINVVNGGYLAENAYVQACEDLVQKELYLVPGVITAHDGGPHVRMTNFGDQDIILHSKTNVGTCQSIYMEEAQETSPVRICSLQKSNSALGEHLQKLLEASAELLSEEERFHFADLLKKYQDIFAVSKKDLGRTNLVKHRINTGTALPVRKPPRRLPLGKRQTEKEEINNMLERGVIQASTSPWASPVVLVTKKDGSTRFCIDYRGLNDLTVKDAYPLPRIDDSLDALSGGKWFCTMDLMSGYWQIEMESEDIPKTAFTTSQGLYEFKVMPFGLTNAPATFERLMESVLRGLQWEECLVYIDDIIIAAASVPQALERMEHVFQRLQVAGLKLKPTKCSFFCKSVKFLGHVVSEQGVHMDPEKTQHVQDWLTPKSAKEVRSFLGLCSYYRRFIAGFAKMARPLHKLTEKRTTFVWDTACEAAFSQLKEALTTAPVLSYPKPEGQFILDTDASDHAVGAVLSQEQDMAERVLGYFSKALTKTEQVYCVTRKELLAVVMALKHFHPYLYGREVILRTDNAAVSWMRNLRTPTGQTARWLELINTYDLQVKHRAGRSHNNADALSRKPCSSCARQEAIEQQHRRERPLPVMNQEHSQASDVPQSCQGTVQVAEEAATTGSDATQSHPDAVRPVEKFDDLAVIHINATTRQQAQPLEAGLRSSHSWLKGWEVEQMRLSQLQDPDIGPVLTQKEEKQQKPEWKDISHLSDKYKSLWAQWGQLEIRGSLLFRRRVLGNASTGGWQLLVPRSKQKEVFEHLHDHATGGHLGTEKTISKIIVAFYWPGLRRDVQQLCKKCDQCAARKPSLGKRKAPLQQYLVGSPMERIAIDVLGPLPKTRQGNQFVVVIGDYFTKWMEAFAAPDEKAETVAAIVVQQFICRFGVPRQLHSDKGSNFESNLFQQVCKLLNIDKTRTTSRRPQSDGMVERFNRTLECMLTMYVEKHQRRWDEFLPYVMLAYRSSVHESTGFSPNMLMLGRELEMPLQTVVPQPAPEEQDGEDIEDYVFELQDTLQDAHEHARLHLRRSAQYQKRQYDHRGARPAEFKPGTPVWYYNSGRRKGVCPKLVSPWKGPFIVIQKVTDVTYKIQKTRRSEPFVCHVDTLKLYEGDNPPTWFRPQEDAAAP